VFVACVSYLTSYMLTLAMLTKYHGVW
jgi:hypothetical protein